MQLVRILLPHMEGNIQYLHPKYISVAIENTKCMKAALQYCSKCIKYH